MTKRVLMCAVCTLFLMMSSANAMSMFYLHYAVVHAMKEKTENNILFNFDEQNPKAAASLADFWWRWAARECRPELRHAFDTAKDKFKDDMKGLTEYAKEAHGYCAQSFIYTHWDDINESIKIKALRFKK